MFIFSENNLMFIVKKLLTKINWQSIVKSSSKVIDYEFKENGFMNEESVKIAKIKKSCSVGKKISNIFFVICVVAFIFALTGSITIFSMGKRFDTAVEKAEAAGYVTTGSSIGNVSGININIDDVTSLHSDIPQLQAAIDDHPYCIYYGSVCVIIAIAVLGTAVLLKLISSVFDLIIKEDSPFTDRVIRRVMIVLIALSAVMLLTTSPGFGLLGGIITWVVYAIMDYGKTLQIQSDETL